MNGCRTPANSLTILHSSQPRDLVSCTDYPTPIQPQVPALNNRCRTQEKVPSPTPCGLLWVCSPPHPLLSAPAGGTFHTLEAQGRSSAHTPLDVNTPFQLGNIRNPPTLPRSDCCRPFSRSLKLKKLPHIWRKSSQSWICSFDEQNAKTNLSLWHRKGV